MERPGSNGEGPSKSNHRKARDRVCPVCGQERDRKKALETSYRALLHGAVRYALCPECLREVPKPWGEAYKRRFRLKVKSFLRGEGGGSTADQ